MSTELGALVMLAGALCMLAASYLVCYMFWLKTWEGWEEWSERTGLDHDLAERERQLRQTKQK